MVFLFFLAKIEKINCKGSPNNAWYSYTISMHRYPRAYPTSMQNVSIYKMLAFCRYHHIISTTYPSHFLGQNYFSLHLHWWQCLEQQPQMFIVCTYLLVFLHISYCSIHKLVAWQSNFDYKFKDLHCEHQCWEWIKSIRDVNNGIKEPTQLVAKLAMLVKYW